jgi:hypothetical protein
MNKSVSRLLGLRSCITVAATQSKVWARIIQKAGEKSKALPRKTKHATNSPVHKGLVAPMDRENVDTDAIIPKQFLKSIRKTGFGQNLFDEWRYLDAAIPGRIRPVANPTRTLC